MTPFEAVNSSRVEIAEDVVFEPIRYFTSPRGKGYAAKKLAELGRIPSAGALKSLGGSGPIHFVEMEQAAKTDNWQPVLPMNAIDKLARIAERSS